jgi:transposase
LLLYKGWTYDKIVEALFLDDSTIANYRLRYKEGGLEELLGDDYKGSASFFTLDEQVELEAHLQENVYLSVKSMLEYVNKRFIVSYTVSGPTALLHRMKFTYKKPKKVPGNANRQAQLDFVTRYKALRREGKIYFGDTVHPHHNPVLGYGWIKREIEMEVSSNSGRHHLNIAGALCLQNMDVITRTFETINASSICIMLKAIRAKNPDLEERIYNVLDNVRHHRAKVVKKLARSFE